jgi:hypothetical protein
VLVNTCVPHYARKITANSKGKLSSMLLNCA